MRSAPFAWNSSSKRSMPSTRRGTKIRALSVPTHSVIRKPAKSCVPSWPPPFPWKAPASPKKPSATSPQKPVAPCTAKASTTSSTFNFFISMDAPWYTRPPKKPMKRASYGWTAAHPAVMATRPARMPLQKPPTSNFFGATSVARSTKTTKPATHGESVVFTATKPAELAVALSCIDPVLPGLKPYHPNQRKNVPRTQKGTLCASNSLARFSSQRPARGPTASAPTRAPMPPTMCTRPLPAKSLSAGPTTDTPSP
mmetsp:Transcript_80674/g.246611  ORF Transcript_80674/g.246611 Transcript_80674/m.246611 type:complete len:255 (+) Transcript_80674:235-999(+)